LSHLQIYEFVHTNERKFSCITCNKQFIHSSNLQQHELIHTNEREFTSITCNGQLISSSNLHRHAFNHLHRFSCMTCDRQFKYLLVNLDTYQVTHNGVHWIICQPWNKKFQTSSSQRRHEQHIHSTTSFDQTGEQRINHIRCQIYVCSDDYQLFIDRLDSRPYNIVIIILLLQTFILFNFFEVYFNFRILGYLLSHSIVTDVTIPPTPKYITICKKKLMFNTWSY